MQGLMGSNGRWERECELRGHRCVNGTRGRCSSAPPEGLRPAARRLPLQSVRSASARPGQRQRLGSGVLAALGIVAPGAAIRMRTDAATRDVTRFARGTAQLFSVYSSM